MKKTPNVIWHRYNFSVSTLTFWEVKKIHAFRFRKKDVLTRRGCIGARSCSEFFSCGFIVYKSISIKNPDPNRPSSTSRCHYPTRNVALFGSKIFKTGLRRRFGVLDGFCLSEINVSTKNNYFSTSK